MGNITDNNANVNININNNFNDSNVLNGDVYIKTFNKEKDLTPYLDNLNDNYYAYKPDSISFDSVDSIATNNSQSFDDNGYNAMDTLRLKSSVDAGATGFV